MTKKKLIKGMTLLELEKLCEKHNLPRFRAKQLFHWLYNKMVSSFDEMENIPKQLRIELDENYLINSLELIETQVSQIERTKKFLFRTKENNLIESVIIPEKKRVTLCLSTQVGCPLDCKFCATGLMGYKKNLTTGEIFDQYNLTQKYAEEKITNIVYMGMGEPLLNYNNTIKSLQIFSDEMTNGISQKKITVSTAGIPPKIIELADTGIKCKLALSLHSCFEDIRTKIMPINEKYSLKENIDAIIYFSKKTGTRITFEYVMLDGINDRKEDIKALAQLCSKVPSKINIIPFNSLAHMNPIGLSAELKPTPKKKIYQFADALAERNITAIVRDTQGADIAAACGQLAVRN